MPQNPIEALFSKAKELGASDVHIGVGAPVLFRISGNLAPQTEQLVTEAQAKQIVEIEKGRQEPVIRVGNLEARRDYTDVRDTVRAYWLSLQKCEAGEVYNICTGKSWAIREVLDLLLARSRVKVRVEPDPARMRPSDVQLLEGDASKFRRATGWAPEIPFERTLEDILAYWRERP